MRLKLKKIKLPHTLVLIYVMVVITVISTWIIPGGEYQRVEKDGRTVPVADSYEFVKRQPQGLGALFISPIKGFIDAAAIIAFVFVVGGAFAIIQKTGAIAAFIHNLALKFRQSKALRSLLIPITMIIFSLGGAVFGMAEEAMPFVLVFVPLALSLGYDTIVGVCIPFVGAASGFAGAFFNPFTVGIAQGIAGLPLYSGVGYRLIIWATGTAIAIIVVMHYASRILKNPRLSPTYDEDLKRRDNLKLLNDSSDKVVITRAHKSVLYLFLAGMLLLVIGILRYKWYINEIAGLFLALGILSGLFGRLKSKEIGEAFVSGAKDMINAALIIGCARAILVVAMDGKILDTMLYYMAKAISGFHPIISSQMMFICQCGINFMVHSGTAQAALTMPIMAPLGDLVGITRQTAVFAFQISEYINPVLPTSGVTMGVLGLAKLSWGKWAKWFLPLLIIWVIFGFLSLIPPVLIRWGPH